MLAGHELLPLALQGGHGFGLQHLVPPRAEAVGQLALVDGRREWYGTSVINNYLPRTRPEHVELPHARAPPRPRPRDVQADLVDRRHRVRREPVQNALF